MSISKIVSKKNGFTYQVDIRDKDHLGLTQRHLKSGFLDSKEAKKYEKNFIDKIELDKLKSGNSIRTFNDIFEEYMQLEGDNKYENATKIYYLKNHEMYVKEKIGASKISSIKYVNLQKIF